jgi:glyoxylase-like metal-dependent hydrolase (beta-lactamase superfamily II)
LIDSKAECPEFFEYLRQQKLSVCAVLCTNLHQTHTGNLYELTTWYYEETYGKHPLCTVAIDEENPVDICGVKFQVLLTYGHAEGPLAFATPDGICCLVDVLLAEDVLQTAKIPYMADVDQALASMEQIRQTDYPHYLLSHGGVIPQRSLSNLVDANIKNEPELYDVLRRQVKAPSISMTLPTSLCPW